MNTSLIHLSLLALVIPSAAVRAQTHLVGLEFDQVLPNGDFLNLGFTGSANDGVPAANASLTTGILGAGVNLTGGADEVAAGPTPLSGGQPRTVSIWARTTQTSGLYTAMTFGINGNGSKWDMDIDCTNAGVIELGIGGGRTIGQGPALNDGAWHMMTTVLPVGATTLGGVRLFVDGDFAYTNSGTRVVATGVGPLVAGRAANAPQFQAFIGDVDDMVIWSEAFTDEQVACLYDVAVEPALGYTATQFEQLLQVYRDVVPSVTVFGRTWSKVSGITGDAGLSTLPNGNFQLRMDANDVGLRETPPASFTSFGTGCAGSAGVPTLSSASVPQVNQTFTAQLANIPAGSNAFMVISFSGQLLPLDVIGMPGCSTFDTQAVAVMLSPTGGVATFDVLPPANALGLTFYEQGFVTDPGANPFGLTSSNAGAALVGP